VAIVDELIDDRPTIDFSTKADVDVDVDVDVDDDDEDDDDGVRRLDSLGTGSRTLMAMKTHVDQQSRYLGRT
jgi:hypothetical protein